jgi:hypothetical protein
VASLQTAKPAKRDGGGILGWRRIDDRQRLAGMRATMLAATWFKSGLLERLGMVQPCADFGKFQVQSEFSGFKKSQYQKAAKVDFPMW